MFLINLKQNEKYTSFREVNHVIASDIDKIFFDFNIIRQMQINNKKTIATNRQWTSGIPDLRASIVYKEAGNSCNEET